MNEKQCTKCRNMRNISEFTTVNGTVKSRCTVCRSDYTKSWKSRSRKTDDKDWHRLGSIRGPERTDEMEIRRKAVEDYIRANPIPAGYIED